MKSAGKLSRRSAQRGFNWASKWKLARKRYLMSENPARGFPIPEEKNPKRPVATRDRFEALRAVSDKHRMRVGDRGKRSWARSYMSELLDIAEATGRRINAICALRYGNLRLEKKPSRPYGAVCWPEDTDKQGYEAEVPLSGQARAAIDRVLQARPGIGDLPMFPSPKNPAEPVSTRTAQKWLESLEELAGLEKLKGGALHPLRRAWATSRKMLPDADVAAAGGWRSTATLKLYQQTDEATMLEVVLGGGQIRAVK